ncbi:hypothetical protein DMC47_12890 [Nostoc sp. 3335mG]|jgi:hypothetical protein|nr:hypothetical protein DMC47_12890 [Nostoc sp. 3335mG]
MRRGPTTIAPEVIACIEHGRNPSFDEMMRVADRIRGDLRGGTSAFSWGGKVDDQSHLLLCLKAAHAALIGDV